MEVNQKYLLRVKRLVTPTAVMVMTKLTKFMPSDGDGLKSSTLFLNEDENLLVQTKQTHPIGKPVHVQLGANPSTLVIHDSLKDFLILAGPSGKGEHQLRASSEVAPFGVGLMIYHTSWQALRTEGAQEMVLRYRDEDIDGGKWVAVPEEGQSWSIWWYEPGPANWDDLPGAVDVDIELVLA
ncbi:hypothetical protein ACJZ2D_005244 [Fusarium nematophilum]